MPCLGVAAPPRLTVISATHLTFMFLYLLVINFFDLVIIVIFILVIPSHLASIAFIIFTVICCLYFYFCLLLLHFKFYFYTYFKPLIVFIVLSPNYLPYFVLSFAEVPFQYAGVLQISLLSLRANHHLSTLRLLDQFPLRLLCQTASSACWPIK